jgi:hypothetical protein
VKRARRELSRPEIVVRLEFVVVWLAEVEAPEGRGSAVAEIGRGEGAVTGMGESAVMGSAEGAVIGQG